MNLQVKLIQQSITLITNDLVQQSVWRNGGCSENTSVVGYRKPSLIIQIVVQSNFYLFIINF